MNRITKALIGLFLAFAIPCAYAATVSLSVTFTRPTTYEGGAPMPASAISSYGIGCTFTPTGGTAAPCSGMTSNSIPGSATSGNFAFNADVNGRVCVQLVTRSNAGLESAPSLNTANSCKDVVIPPAIPSAPGSVSITIAVTIT